MIYKWIYLFFISICLIPSFSFSQSPSAQHFIYSVRSSLDMGNPGEKSLKDFYINMGTQDGLNEGATLEVLRHSTSYDLLNEEVHSDITYPIATLKVIHVGNESSVARLKRFFSMKKTPLSDPHAVMIGDLVRTKSSQHPRTLSSSK